jgi:hypothetical protein
VIRTIFMLAFWAVALPVAAVLCFPWTFLTSLPWGRRGPEHVWQE